VGNVTVESSTENTHPTNDELLEALYRTDRWLRKINKAIKNGPPEDEEAEEKFALQLKRARRQVRANKPLLAVGDEDDLARDEFGDGED
jgi:hypothetical protein